MSDQELPLETAILYARTRAQEGCFAQGIRDSAALNEAADAAEARVRQERAG